MPIYYIVFKVWIKRRGSFSSLLLPNHQAGICLVWMLINQSYTPDQLYTIPFGSFNVDMMRRFHANIIMKFLHISSFSTISSKTWPINMTKAIPIFHPHLSRNFQVITLDLVGLHQAFSPTRSTLHGHKSTIGRQPQDDPGVPRIDGIVLVKPPHVCWNWHMGPCQCKGHKIMEQLCAYMSSCFT